MKTKASLPLLVIVLIAYFLVGSFWTEVRILKGQNIFPGFLQAATKKTVPQPGKIDIKISSGDPVRGDKNAPVTLVEFADYQCPFCGAVSGLDKATVSYMKKVDPSWEPLGPALLKEYINTGKVKMIYKDYAFLDDGSDGGESHLAAMAAHCAGDQKKYWEFHDYLYSHQNGENKGTFSAENLTKYAGNLNLDQVKFKKCLDDKKYAGKVKENVQQGQQTGVNGTPTIFINGVLVTDESGQSGALPFSVYRDKIEKELAGKKKFIFF